MRSDGSNFYSPTMSQSKQPVSSQVSRPRPQNSAKSPPSFHLGSLPRFHPAVYQSQHSSHSTTSQPPSPLQSRQHTYRPSSSSRDALRQYRELVESVTLARTPPGPLSPSPSAPRLDPLRSPGPVTPLTLEESSGYLTAGVVNASEQAVYDNQHHGPSPDLLVEKLITRESERARPNSRTNSIKGR